MTVQTYDAAFGNAPQGQRRHGAEAGWRALEELCRAGWSVAATLTQEGREGRHVPLDEVPCGPAARRYFARAFPRGPYAHQADALRRLAAGRNVCLATGTASGKSAVFYARALDVLSAPFDGASTRPAARADEPGPRVLALYPLKALATEQEERWALALQEAFPNPSPGAGRPQRPRVGRIDGSVPVRSRPDVLQVSSVVVATPDVLHSWLLPHVGEPVVRRFLRRLRLVVVDEVHQYTGVFGSNAAYVFRRLRHLLHLLGGGEPQFIAASATIAAPDSHLAQLFGVPFDLIDAEADASERHPSAIHLLRPPPGSDLLDSVADLVRALSAQQASRFVVFVDSRKQAELIAAVARRRKAGEALESEVEEETAAAAEPSATDGPLPGRGPGAGRALVDLPLDDVPDAADVLPYRAGLEESDRRAIQRALQDGSLRGVVSTSALELGIDLPHLDVGVLVGVPHSATSLRQRIGRVGRARPGSIFVVGTGSLLDEAVLDDPSSLFERPPAESALYLANRRVQYIHALCLARQGGEHDQALAGSSGAPAATVAPAGAVSEEAGFRSPIQWPDGFLELCARERSGVVEPDLQSMKVDGGDEPQLAFPLRDVELQFRVEARGREGGELGTLTYSQLMREAYPGAVYYYMATPYRVVQVMKRTRRVVVRRERFYTTRPVGPPAQLFPDFSPERVFAAWQYGRLQVVETAAQVTESVTGFKERRGNRELDVSYPLRTGEDDGGSGLSDRVFFSMPRFNRTYFTTAVLLFHPGFEEPEVELARLGELIFEAFLYCVPFERQDIGVTTFRVRQGVEFDGGEAGVQRLPDNSRFVAIFDQTYGSLRLSGRLLEGELLGRVLAAAAEMARKAAPGGGDQRTARVLNAMAEDAKGPPVPWRILVRGESFGGPAAGGGGALVRVIRPGSRGVGLKRDNEEFIVDKVLPSHPRHQGPVYKGRFVSEERHDTTATFVAVSDIAPIPGVSELVWYDPEGDEFREEADEGGGQAPALPRT